METGLPIRDILEAPPQVQDALVRYLDWRARHLEAQVRRQR